MIDMPKLRKAITGSIDSKHTWGIILDRESCLGRDLTEAQAAEIIRRAEAYEGLVILLEKTVTSFRENNRSLTANQANAWQDIEQAIAGINDD